ncbi:MAG: hypothetical protein K2O08_04320 [Clostridia bacterium]|nr:hypothetical protein [Clostridia bacterium]
MSYNASPKDFVGTWRSIYYIDDNPDYYHHNNGYLYLKIEMTEGPTFFRNKAKYRIFNRFHHAPSASDSSYTETGMFNNRTKKIESISTDVGWNFSYSSGKEDFEYYLVSPKKLVRFNSALGIEEFYRIG